MKLHTLCEDHLYRKVYKNGKKYVGKKTVVYSLRDLKAEQLRRENPQKKKINRIGITVSVKLGSAVARNRVKRIIREAYRQTAAERCVKCGFLRVIAARNGARDAKTGDIKEELLKAFSHLGLFEDEKRRNRHEQFRAARRRKDKQHGG